MIGKVNLFILFFVLENIKEANCLNRLYLPVSYEAKLINRKSSEKTTASSYLRSAR